MDIGVKLVSRRRITAVDTLFIVVAIVASLSRAAAAEVLYLSCDWHVINCNDRFATTNACAIMKTGKEHFIIDVANKRVKNGKGYIPATITPTSIQWKVTTKVETWTFRVGRETLRYDGADDLHYGIAFVHIERSGECARNPPDNS